MTIGNSVTSIGHGAFDYCTGLTRVSVGTGLASIPVLAFSECSNLATVILGNGVTSLGEWASGLH